MDVPRLDKFNGPEFKQFSSDLDHYVTQLVLDNSIRARHDSVAVPLKSKEAIRSYLQALRSCIEGAQMSEKKRDALLARLLALESELEKRRLSMLSVARVAYHLWAVPGSSWASYEIANKLITNIMQTVAEAKSVEEEQKALTDGSLQPLALSQKPMVPPQRAATKPAYGQDFSDDLDNDGPL